MATSNKEPQARQSARKEKRRRRSSIKKRKEDTRGHYKLEELVSEDILDPSTNSTDQIDLNPSAGPTNPDANQKATSRLWYTFCQRLDFPQFDTSAPLKPVVLGCTWRRAEVDCQPLLVATLEVSNSFVEENSRMREIWTMVWNPSTGKSSYPTVRRFTGLYTSRVRACQRAA